MMSTLPRRSARLNPELEALREKGLQENSFHIIEWASHMIKKTAHIHAGFLFEERKTLQDICLFISETPNKITDDGWELFGYHLGLSPSILKVINHNNFNKEDPCYNVLLSYVQYEKASIGKIIEALLLMSRIDVLNRIQDSINYLAYVILNGQNNSNVNNSVEETSDYESLSAFEGSGGSNSPTNINSSSELFIKPKVIPPAPFIFQNLQGTPELLSQQLQQTLRNIVSTNLCTNFDKNNCSDIENPNNQVTCVDNVGGNLELKVEKETLQQSGRADFHEKSTRKSRKQNYGLKILLTFAVDGEKYVEEICKVFRKKRDDYPSIGVLVLSEHTERVIKDSEQFISGAFHQVDYVCPILTTGYHDLITKKQKAATLSNNHIDASFAPYIYRLISSYFVLNHCLNDKVRCIIPESESPSLPHNFAMMNPVFEAWVKLTEVEELAVRLLKSNAKKI